MSESSSTFSSAAIARSSSSGAVAQALHLATRFLLTPFVVLGVGLEAYAYWSLLFALLGWIGLHRTGFVSAAVPLGTAHLAAGRKAEADELFRAAAGIVTVLGVACLTAAWLWGGALATWLDVAPDLRLAAQDCLMIAVAATALSLAGAGFQNSLEARNAFPTVKAIEIGAAFLESALIALALWLDAGLQGLALAYATRLAVQTLGCAIYAQRLSPGIRVLPGRASLSAYRRVWRFGLAMQGIGFLHLSIGSIDRLLFVRLLGLGTAGLLELARKLVGFAAGIVAQGLAPLEPAVAHHGVKSPQVLRGLVEGGARLTSFFGLIPLAVLAAAPSSIIMAWLGEVPDGAPFVLRVVAVGAFIHLATGPWTAALRGLAEPRLESFYAALWLILLLLGVPTGQALGGMEGAVIGAASAQTVASLVLILCASRRFGSSPLGTLKELATAISLGGAVAFLVASFTPAIEATQGRLETTVVAGLAALATVALLLPLGAILILGASDRAAVLAILRRRSAAKITQPAPELVR